MKRNVFKLGGAFFDAETIKNFFKTPKQGNTLYVVSAMKGSTRILRYMASLKVEDKLPIELRDGTISLLFDSFKKDHFKLIDDLFENGAKDPVTREFEILCGEINECLLNERLSPDELYASILQFGELASSQILSRYLLSIGTRVTWFDARDYVTTTSDYRNAEIESINPDFQNLFSRSDVLLTQGFIGRTVDGKNTVIGFDGSDRSASEFADSFPDEVEVSLVFFKEVTGVYDDDPFINPKAQQIFEMTYDEYRILVIRLGNRFVVRPDALASVEKKKNIITEVRSFKILSHPGTVIKSLSQAA